MTFQVTCQKNNSTLYTHAHIHTYKHIRNFTYYSKYIYLKLKRHITRPKEEKNRQQQYEIP